MSTDGPRVGRRIRLAARLALVPYLALLAFAFFWPAVPAVGPGRSDLAGHLAMFTGLAVLLSLALRRWRIALVVGLVLAVAVEAVQLGIPGRNFERADMAVNVLAVLSVGWAWRWWEAEARRRDEANG